MHAMKSLYNIFGNEEDSIWERIFYIQSINNILNKYK